MSDLDDLRASVGMTTAQDALDGAAIRVLRAAVPSGYAVRIEATPLVGAFVGVAIIDPATGKEADRFALGEWWTGATVAEAASAMTEALRHYPTTHDPYEGDTVCAHDEEPWPCDYMKGKTDEADTRAQPPGTRPV